MTHVFIGGSRAVSRLNPLLRQKLDDLMARQCQFLVGDANGADRAVQRYLAERHYGNVIVFCMGRCRNNLGGWQIRAISSGNARRDFAYYATKDRVMAQEAKCGVMLWDAKSKGTLNNIMTLIGDGKKVLVYLAPERKFYKLSSEADLRQLLSRCDPRQLERVTRQLGWSEQQRGASDDLPLIP